MSFALGEGYGRIVLLLKRKRMEENISIRKAFHEAISLCKGKPLASDATSLENYYDVCCGCVLLAEDDLKAHRRCWEIAGLAETFLHYASYLEGFDHMLDRVYPAVRRMTDCVNEHKRLHLRLLRLKLMVIRRIEAKEGHELSLGEEVESEVRRYERNIKLADEGRYDEIVNTGHLKQDTIEWSQAYENAIDDVERETDVLLATSPHGMGFCFAYWHAKAVALRCNGVEWKSPGVMNPHVMFD